MEGREFNIPLAMMNLGIRSTFQSLLDPNSLGGSALGLKSFQRAVKFKEAPSSP